MSLPFDSHKTPHGTTLHLVATVVVVLCTHTRVCSRYDEDIDRRMGSARAFMLRVTVGMGVKIGMLFFMPFVPSLFSQSQIPTVMLLCLVVMGTMTWMIHGTACQV